MRTILAMPKVGMQPIRQKQLIEATFKVIEAKGLNDTTMSSVAYEAGLSTGIVSHYFGNKDGLLFAVMREVLRNLRAAVLRHYATARDRTPRAQLRAIVEGNFDASQTDPAAVKTWLAFWSASLNRPALSRLQMINHRRLKSNLSHHFSRVLGQKNASDAATGLAALIDGLWLRGTLIRDGHDIAQARKIAFDYIDYHLATASSNLIPSNPEGVHHDP